MCVYMESVYVRVYGECMWKLASSTRWSTAVGKDNQSIYLVPSPTNKTTNQKFVVENIKRLLTLSAIGVVVGNACVAMDRFFLLNGE